jgi:hypothetical protein
MFKVSNYGTGHGFVFVIRQVAFSGSFFYDFGNFSVMNMTDVGKNMVLNLVV